MSVLTWLAPFIVLAVVAVAVAVKLLVRRRAPEGGWFTDFPRSAGSLSVIGTMFAVMLAFVILFSLQSFQRAREGANREAVAVTELSNVASVLPPPTGDRLRGELVCYGRAVVHDEWPLMASGRSSPVVDDWVTRIDTALVGVPTQTTKEVEVFNMWLERSDERQEGRRGRLAEALPLIPLFVWVMLVLLLALVIGYQVLFTRANLPLLPQAIGVGATAATLITGMVIVYVLDMPFADRGAALAPIRMQATLSVLESQYQGSPESIPCDATGRPRS